MFKPWSIRYRLLVAVNAAMLVPLAVFLVLDYSGGIAERVDEKHVSLQEEAKTLLPGILRVRDRGTKAVQDYVDSVCGAMREPQSPGHHIAVRLGGDTLQALAHHRASAEILEAMEAAADSPTHSATIGDRRLVVGSASREDVTVYVSEYLTNIRRAVRGQIVWRLLRIVVLLLLVAVAVNAVFLRMATGPLQQLVETVRRIGEGELGTRARTSGSREFNYLAEAVNTMSSSLAEVDRRRRLEMDRARRIQEQLLPETVDVPGFHVAHWYRPAEEVAGDFYDVFSLPGGVGVICVADVSGHGVPAALSATMLKALLSHASDRHDDPGEVLGFINERLTVAYPTDNFASMFLAFFDRRAMSLRYASAGHEIGLLLSPHGPLRRLPATGLMLGVLEDAAWETETIEIGEGDRLLVVTDGITEALSPEGELFGRDRLAETFRRARGAVLAEALRVLEADLASHRRGRAPADDQTVVAVEFVGPAP